MRVTLDSNLFTIGGEQMLKSVAVFGANASGKSNVIKAIRACVSMIRSSHNYNEDTVFGFKPFKFEGYDLRPSCFYIRFIMDSVEYEYSFSMTQTEILTEQLYYYPNGRRSLVFSHDERKGPDKKDVYEFKFALKRPMDVAVNTSRKTLFISRASQMDRETMARKERVSKGKTMRPNYFVFCEGDTEVAYIDMLRSYYRLPIHIIAKKTLLNITSALIERCKSVYIQTKDDRTYLMYDLDVEKMGAQN